MRQLQLLDLSENGLYELDFDTFRNTRRLQATFHTENLML